VRFWSEANVRRPAFQVGVGGQHEPQFHADDGLAGPLVIAEDPRPQLACGINRRGPRRRRPAPALATPLPRSGRFQNGSKQRPGIEVIYLTDDPQVTLYETRAIIGSPLPSKAHVTHLH